MCTLLLNNKPTQLTDGDKAIYNRHNQTLSLTRNGARIYFGNINSAAADDKRSLKFNELALVLECYQFATSLQAKKEVSGDDTSELIWVFNKV